VSTWSCQTTDIRTGGGRFGQSGRDLPKDYRSSGGGLESQPGIDASPLADRKGMGGLTMLSDTGFTSSSDLRIGGIVAVEEKRDVRSIQDSTYVYVDDRLSSAKKSGSRACTPKPC
jgi:hypothetical protein